ncbi:MAG: hypothetical protein ACO32S_01555 [Steroidobacteraceae bacterium]
MSACPINQVSPDLAPTLAAVSIAVALTFSFFWGLIEASGSL